MIVSRGFNHAGAFTQWVPVTKIYKRNKKRTSPENRAVYGWIRFHRSRNRKGFLPYQEVQIGGRKRMAPGFSSGLLSVGQSLLKIK